ncbi:MAG: DUF2461 domain-containing protein [Flavobacteriaceae bacterium]|nr:DUF2461 domain-containing protein [Flavobacteriaceae bacterium]MDG2503652.1 DUF2461 domain-containing protein [Flavobacteriaceae bacterium]
MQVINPEVLRFFETLEKNNKREWFEPQKPHFKALEAEVKVLGEELKTFMNETDEIDKVKFFRIYRDVRFSKNKTPFKTHFGMSFNRKKPHLRGGYYIHIAPGDSFLAAGFWNPDKEDLFRIRKEMEMDAEEFRKLLKDPQFVKAWGGLTGEEVKTAPKGFSKEHSNIDLIKKKQYLFIKKLDDSAILAPNFQKEVIQHFNSLRPIFNYFSNLLTTDLNGVSIL